MGEQVWRGALYLADYLLHIDTPPDTAIQQDTSNNGEQDSNSTGASPSSVVEKDGRPLVRGQRVLELASGVGLTSIVAAITAHTVVITGNVRTYRPVLLSLNVILIFTQEKNIEYQDLFVLSNLHRY